MSAPGGPHAEERDARARLDRSLLRGVAWTGGIRWAAQAFTWVATIYVARVLSPEDYGLVGMAAVYFGFVMLVNELGLGAAVVILRDLSEAQIRQLNGLAVLFGGVCFGLSVLVAGPIGDFYEAREIPAIIVAMSAAFLIVPFRTVPRALLERELQFRGMALVEGSQAVVGASATVLLATQGFAYWSLVVGNLVAAFLSSTLFFAIRPQAFAWPRPTAIGSSVRIGWHILVGRVSWYVYSNADFLIAGKLLGKQPLGFYSFAFTLASIPIDRITAMVATVTPAVFSAVQSEHAALRRYFLGLSGALALVTMPATWGLALVAPDFVPVVLGEKWLGAVRPLQLLAFYASFRCLTPMLSHVLNVTGHTRFGMWMGVVSAVVLPVGFLVGSRWGTVGIASAWLCLHPLVTAPHVVLTFRTIQVRPADYLRAIWPALSGSLLMAAAVAGLRWGVAQGAGPALRLALEVPVGVAVYAATLLAFQRPRLRASLQVLRRLRG